MGVDTNNVVIYGYKLPYVHVEDEEFADFLHNEHNPKWQKEIDPDKIYMLDDNYGCEYTVVGYVIEWCQSGEGFCGFVDLDVNKPLDPIIQFLWQEKFEDLIPEDLGDPELFVFTHHS